MRVDPAAPASPGFSLDDLDELIDDVRRWNRVRDPSILDPNDLLTRVVGGMFGARLDGYGGRLEFLPVLPGSWKAVSLRGLRAHRTLLDVELKPRAEWLTFRLDVTFGPPLAVHVALPTDVQVQRVAVDEVPLEAASAVFTARAEHEVVFFIAARATEPDWPPA